MKWNNINNKNLKDWFESKDQFEKVKTICKEWGATEINGLIKKEGIYQNI